MHAIIYSPGFELKWIQFPNFIYLPIPKATSYQLDDAEKENAPNLNIFTLICEV